VQEPALVGEQLTLTAFTQLSGTLGGYRFVKLVLDRETGLIHFLDSRENLFHVKYVAAHILHLPPGAPERRLDELNHEVYQRKDRRFCLGTLALHQQKFFSLETVEADTMTAEMLRHFYDEVRANVDQILLKPANHLQESHVANIPTDELPRILSHELFSTNAFVPLNPGTAEGTLRIFLTAEEYSQSRLAWHDIIVMAKVPDDIPRLTGGCQRRAHHAAVAHERPGERLGRPERHPASSRSSSRAPTNRPGSPPASRWTSRTWARTRSSTWKT
jgi:hypothetical protein